MQARDATAVEARRKAEAVPGDGVAEHASVANGLSSAQHGIINATDDWACVAGEAVPEPEIKTRFTAVVQGRPKSMTRLELRVELVHCVVDVAHNRPCPRPTFASGAVRVMHANHIRD